MKINPTGVGLPAIQYVQLSFKRRRRDSYIHGEECCVVTGQRFEGASVSEGLLTKLEAEEKAWSSFSLEPLERAGL